MKKVSRIVWGIALIAVGLILALNAFDITDINLFFDGWWTLFIIVPCTVSLITSYDKSGSIIGICIGLFLLLCCQDLLSFDLFWKLFFPVVIVIIGLKMIFGNLFGSKGDRVFEEVKENNGSIRSVAATFSGSTLDYSGEVFEGAKLDAVFGGVKCDLRGAVINGDCVINASAIFGGIDIYIPAGHNVKVNSNSIFGGVSGKSLRNDPNNPYTLYLNASCLFGGVEVK